MVQVFFVKFFLFFLGKKKPLYKGPFVWVGVISDGKRTKVWRQESSHPLKSNPQGVERDWIGGVAALNETGQRVSAATSE